MLKLVLYFYLTRQEFWKGKYELFVVLFLASIVLQRDSEPSVF